MRKLYYLFIIFAFLACDVTRDRIQGNGNTATETRETDSFTKIKISGSFDVELVPGTANVKVEADDNLLPYIITESEGGWLHIRERDDVRLQSRSALKVYISTDMLKAIEIGGSGHVVAKGKFTGAEKLSIKVAGSGDVDLEVNTPVITVDIAGSGNVTLTGETRDASVNMAGSGKYDATGLLTENTSIDMAGSGTARVHADNTIHAKLIGSGNVYYRGKAQVKSSSIGSGSIQSID